MHGPSVLHTGLFSALTILHLASVLQTCCSHREGASLPSHLWLYLANSTLNLHLKYHCYQTTGLPGRCHGKEFQLYWSSCLCVQTQ